MLLTEICQRHETGRLKHVCTGENATKTPKTRNKHDSTLQISKERDLIVASYRSFTAFLVGSVFCLPTRLLSIIVSFSCIYISRGSVATQLMCGGIFNNHYC